MDHVDKRDFDGTTRGVYATLIKNPTRMALFGMPERAKGEAEWHLADFETRFTRMLDGEDEEAADGILEALRTDYADVTLSRAWLDQLRRLHGGTDVAVLLYAAMTGRGIGLNDVDGLGRGADVEISFIGQKLLVELWIGTRMCIDSNGNASFEEMPGALRMALPGMRISAIAEDVLLEPFEHRIASCGEGVTLGSVATVAMPDDRVRCGDLGPDDVRGISDNGRP